MTQSERDRLSRVDMAAHWCALRAEGPLSEADRTALERWLAADADNRETLDQLWSLWSAAPGAPRTPALVDAIEDALAAMVDAESSAGEPRRASPRPGRGWMAGAVAACLALLAVALYFILVASPEHMRTGIGERRVVHLNDGSRMSMDADTEMEVDFKDERRTIRLLAGRARFQVAKDPLRPFIVVAGDRKVVATGTAFSVELIARQMQVVLFEGKVSVLAAKPPRVAGATTQPASTPPAKELSPGSILIAELDAPSATVVPVDLQRAQSWEAGQLTFVDEPLAIAAARVNRYSRVQIEVDPAIRNLPVSGIFNEGDTASFVEGVRVIHHLAVATTEDTIKLSGKN